MIFLDVDGVCADFCDAAISIWIPDTPVRKQFMRTYPRGEWSIPKALGLTDTEFWARIKMVKNFWSAISQLPEALDLYTALKKEDDVIFLTHANDGFEFWAQRPEWICANMGVLPAKLSLVIQHKVDKHHYNRGDAILVDDNDANCEAWGRNVVLFPQVWNKNHVLADTGINKVAWTMERVKEIRK